MQRYLGNLSPWEAKILRVGLTLILLRLIVIFLKEKYKRSKLNVFLKKKIIYHIYNYILYMQLIMDKFAASYYCRILQPVKRVAVKLGVI